jgi:hypothetical protein
MGATISDDAEEKSATPFADQVADALSDWVLGDARSAFRTLVELLGCPDTHGDVHPRQVTPDDELLIRQTWITLLYRGLSSTGSPLAVERHTLAGLLTNDRWSLLMASEKSAYAFVLLAASFMDKPYFRQELGPPSAGHRQLFVRAQLAKTLEPWLPFGGADTMTERDIAVAFFGAAWCAIVYDNRPDGVTFEILIEKSQPPFLPGRLAIDVAPEDYELPVLQ